MLIIRAFSFCLVAIKKIGFKNFVIMPAKDWQQRWGYQPVLLETFVDPQYFAGTCYQAANFKYLGLTSGMGLRRQGKSYTTNPKKIFVYPLVDNFQQILSSDTVGRVAG